MIMRSYHHTKPVVLVTGATGAQGGSVARHLLRRGRYAVRALTRQPRSAEARALERSGAEVVRGDLYDLESLREALDGCYGAFGVTSFWEHLDGEYRQGINLADAVADAGVGHFVFSTLPSVQRLTDGALRCAEFDMKAGMEAYARATGAPATFVHVAYHYENFLGLFPPVLQADGSYRFGFPQGDTPLAAVAADDVGGVVARIFERRDELLGRVLHLVGDERTPDEYAAIMSRLSGRRVRYTHVPADVFAAYAFPGARDLANRFEFQRSRTPGAQPDLCRTRELYPEVRDFDAWLRAHREALESVLGS